GPDTGRPPVQGRAVGTSGVLGPCADRRRDGGPDELCADAVGDALRGQAQFGEDLPARGVVEELLRDSQRQPVDPDAGRLETARERRSDATVEAVVLDADHQTTAPG